MTKKKFDSEKLRRQIIKLLSLDDFRPLRKSDIARGLKIHPKLRVEYTRLLKEMVRQGSIVRVKGGRYILPKEEELITGVLRGNRRGFGFVTPLDASTSDLYIHRENMSTALDGDTVLVRVVQTYKRRGLKTPLGPEGEIVEVIKRAEGRITGTLQKSGGLYYVIPDNLAIFNDIYIDPAALRRAVIGDKVVCRITEWSSKHLNPEGKIVRVLGSSSDFSSELKAIVERFDLPKGFPRNVQDQAREIPAKISPSEMHRRVDYRDHEVFTIDPETAKDFDDAVSLTYDAGKKTYTLGVHIADVAHYVDEGTPLDGEAAARCNSYYLTGSVIPMLPTRLSNDLCSLKPGVPRLTKSVIMKFSAAGDVLDCSIHDSVIRSRKRFTYKEVLEIIEGRAKSPFSRSLKKMSEFADVLLTRRRERGSVTFDMPEIQVVLDGAGEIAGLKKESGDRAHSLVEEFMLAANETVARHLAKQGVPAIYRVHAEPDEAKLKDLADIARFFGHRLRKRPTHQEIQRLLDRVKGEPISYLLNVAFLKTMKIAEYSTQNIGHFGLASQHYVHFTSPIRRYPDLTIHRCLNLLNGRTAGKGRKRAVGRLTGKMSEIAKKCSKAERRADEAEKALDEIAVFRYLYRLWSARKTKVCNGVVREVNSRGMIIYLDDFMVQGIVKMSSLVNDYFRVSEEKKKLIGVRSRKTYTIGQEIRVRIKRVDIMARELELTPAAR